MSELFIGKEYSVDPSQIRFDQTITEFNRVYNQIEYEATKMSIQESGQDKPICINNKTGLCEDGRHRTKICKELNIDVKCIQIDGDSSIKSRIDIYNMETMSGRDLTAAQRAIQAHRYLRLVKSGVKLAHAAKKFKVSTREVNEANTIAGLGRQDILDTIAEEGVWMIPDKAKPSKSLRAISSYLKSQNEEIEVEEDNTSKIDYLDLINTEKGKSEFFNIRTLVTMSGRELNMLVVDYLNLKYRLKVDELTGEVIDISEIVYAENGVPE